jgi:cephalosporin-C deacetylase-like acetyl esterase
MMNEAEDKAAIEAFWESVDQGLAGVPADPTLEIDGYYSQPEWTVCRMHYNSLHGERLFAWLSVPNESPGATVPALVRMPDYASVHDIIYTPLRQYAVVMNATHRGQRNSDRSMQAQYPGLLTEGIDWPETYVMRRVFADALCAVDALRSLTEVAVGPLVLTGAGLGASLALATAARRPGIAAVAADTPLILGRPEALDGNPPYPLGELNDYLRLGPDRAQAVQDSCAPLDILQVASGINVPVLLSLGSRDRGQCPLAIGEALANLLPQCDLRVYEGGGEGGGHPHAVVRGAWLRERLGLA